jgi:hypothetical protein
VLAVQANDDHDKSEDATESDVALASVGVASSRAMSGAEVISTSNRVRSIAASARVTHMGEDAVEREATVTYSVVIQTAHPTMKSIRRIITGALRSSYGEEAPAVGDTAPPRDVVADVELLRPSLGLTVGMLRQSEEAI